MLHFNTSGISRASEPPQRTAQYFARRARQERRTAARARDPQIQIAHLKAAGLHEQLAAVSSKRASYVWPVENVLQMVPAAPAIRDPHDYDLARRPPLRVALLSLFSAAAVVGAVGSVSVLLRLMSNLV